MQVLMEQYGKSPAASTTVPVGAAKSNGECSTSAGFARILQFTPLLWIIGILPFCTPLMVVFSFFRDRCWKHLADPAIFGWFAIAGAQVLSTAINWGNTSESVLSLIYRCFSAIISGWIFLGMTLAIGKELGFERVARLSRGIALIGLYILVLGIPLFAIGLALGIDELQWLTPVGHLIPASLPSARFQFTAQFLFADLLMDRSMPRLVLFYPWPTCMGLAGTVVFFVSLTRRRGLLKTLGLCGGLFGLAASASRAATAGGLAGLVVYGLLRLPRLTRPYVLFTALTVGLGCFWFASVAQLQPTEWFGSAQSSITNLREGSTSGRDDLYAATYQKILQRPYLGYGWQGDILEDYIPLNLGSHSTIYGLLYTGGIMTLFPFAIVALVMAWRLLRNAYEGGRREQAALCCYLVLLMMCYGECIYAFAVPLFFAFLWMGAALNRPPAEEKFPPVLTSALSRKEFAC